VALQGPPDRRRRASCCSSADTRCGFELPATLQLQASAQYLWHVLATGPNGRSAEAAGQFRRLDLDTEQALLRAESAMPGLDATGVRWFRNRKEPARIRAGPGIGCASDRPGGAPDESRHY